MDPLFVNILKYLLRLVLIVGASAFLGSIFEQRNWSGAAGYLARPLLKIGRLPKICAAAFVTAFFSQSAANSMISIAYSDKKISRRSLILSGIANSYPSKLSHTTRTMFAVIPALGLAAVIYFAYQIASGLFRTIIILLLGRSKVEESDEAVIPEAKKVPDWNVVIRKAFKRTKILITRIFLFTVPMYIIVSMMAKLGLFALWKNSVPESLVPYFPPEIIAVMISRMGGLISAAGVAHGLQEQGLISVPQILIAFLAGNIITNPIRTLRRNLPIATGIFPENNGIIVVLILQMFRLISAITAIAVIVFIMRYFG